MGVAVMAVAAVVSAVASYKSYQETKRQGAAQEEQFRQTEAQNKEQAAASRRAALRRARSASAAAAAAGVATGTTGGSADAGIQGQISGAVADNVSKTSGQLLSIGNQSAQNQIIAASQRRQQTFAAIGNFATDIGSASLQTKAGQKFLASI